MAQHMLRFLRRRTILLPDNISPGVTNPGTIDGCEATLFRAWAFAKPLCHGESDADHNWLTSRPDWYKYADQDKIHYPVQEDKFWTEGDEGT
ncbi:hypothetical protein MMC34_007142 [Xylographa carneopallida]|nr:hypothetical protein [Xylographa carneopallida]